MKKAKIEFIDIKDLFKKTLQFIVFLATSAVVFNFIDRIIKLLISQ